MLLAAAALFGGVYWWSAGVLALAMAGLLAWCRVLEDIRAAFRAGHRANSVSGERHDVSARWLRALDVALVAILAGILIQLVPLPAPVVSVLSPARLSYLRATSLQSDLPFWVPLTLSPVATVHGALATFNAFAAFWTARALFARGGVHAALTTLAAGAVAMVLVAITWAWDPGGLVYGFWQPLDAGARPLGPFINRNHFGTWSLLVIFLSFGCLRWRRTSAPTPGPRSWRTRLAHALDDRSTLFVLALVLLVLGVAIGASRSTMLALACGSGYVAATSPANAGGTRQRVWMAGLVLAAVLAVLAYADLDRVASRIDETRQLGWSGRSAIWRDAIRAARDFPISGVGAGCFAIAMRVYQTSDRTYFWNDAHNHYLHVVVEGGLLLAVPSTVALAALIVLAARAVRRRDDAAHWVRLGASAALGAVAVQSMWETGLALPANGMLAGVAAALVVRSPRSAGPHGTIQPAPDAPGSVHDSFAHAAARR